MARLDTVHVGAILEAAATGGPDAYKFFLAGTQPLPLKTKAVEEELGPTDVTHPILAANAER